jgi:Rieske Fe-S protein
MSEDDKYPPTSGRRRFVKGVVGGSALAGVTTGGSIAIESSTMETGTGGGTTTFVGAENVAGPARRAMPQIPLELDDDGYLRGVWPEASERERGGETVTVAETQLGGRTYSSKWFQYCGCQNYPGVQPDADQDNYIRYASQAPYDWQEQMESGAKVHVDDLQDYENWGNGVGASGLGKPARCRWRSEDLPEEKRNLVLPVVLLRSPKIEAAAEESEWLAASTVRGTVAIFDKCTHFCCTPGFKETEQSAKFDAENELYCGCHQSVYDPFNLVERVFTALPRSV